LYVKKITGTGPDLLYLYCSDLYVQSIYEDHLTCRFALDTGITSDAVFNNPGSPVVPAARIQCGEAQVSFCQTLIFVHNKC